MRDRPLITAVLLAAMLAALGPAAATATSFATLEGQVVALGTAPGEGEMPLVVATLATGDGRYEVALAPAEVLSEIGFEVEVGDRLRVRVFVEPQSEAGAEGVQPPRTPAQKMLNLTRGTMVRLRSLHRVPIWDSTGAWQGGPARLRPGWRRGGQPSSGSGPGPHR